MSVTQTAQYVSLARLRLNGTLYRAGHAIPGLDAETAVALLAAGLVVEGVNSPDGGGKDADVASDVEADDNIPAAAPARKKKADR